MVKCKDCFFHDYHRTGAYFGYHICILNGTKKVNPNIEIECKKFKKEEVE